MDLGKCPRCGADWIERQDICRKCGYVGIGFGLQIMSRHSRKAQFGGGGGGGGIGGFRTVNSHKVTKLKKLKVAYIRDWPAPNRLSYPTSLGCFILLAMTFQSAPWRNDFQGIRTLLGDPKGSSFVGSWEITHDYDKSGKPYPARSELTGFMTLYPTGVVKIRFQRGHEAVDAQGRYVQVGDKVSLAGVRPVGDGADEKAIPKDVLELGLSWKDSNNLSVVVGGQETLTLQRTDPDPFSEP